MMIWVSQVLISFAISGIIHAFLCPFPTTYEKPIQLNNFFHCHRGYKPRIFQYKPYELGFMSSARCVFSAFPSSKIKGYTAWIDKVKRKKAQFWKDQWIYYLVHISRLSLMFNPNMLIASLLVSGGSTNTFQMHCGMVTPILFDIVAIAGLCPNNETFYPTLITNIKQVFDLDRTTYKHFVKYFHESDSGEVSDQKHIAFLTYMISHFVFGSSSL